MLLALTVCFYSWHQHQHDFADFISREDALQIVLPHILDLDKEGGPGLGQVAPVQTSQVFYNKNQPVGALTLQCIMHEHT